MKPHQLLEALEEATRALGMELEYDDIRKGAVATYGDAYTLRGEKRILIHKKLDDAEKADLLIEILSGFDTEGIHLAPEIRKRFSEEEEKVKERAAREEKEAAEAVAESTDEETEKLSEEDKEENESEEEKIAEES